MPQIIQLVLGVAAMVVLVVCGCIMTRKPTKKAPTKTG
jgi:outer membrane murein-binding lipoprotein Lpp